MIEVAAPAQSRDDSFCVPPLSSALAKLLALKPEEREDARLLELILMKDPAAVARLLSLANSAYYAGRKRSTTVAEAVQALGTQAVYDAMLVIWMSGLIAPHPRFSQVSTYLVRHIFSMSATARKLRSIAGLLASMEDSDLALCAILDKLPLATLLVPERGGPAQDQLLKMATEGSHLFRTCNALRPILERSSAFAKAWGSPSCVVETLEQLRSPRPQAGQQVHQLLGLAEGLLDALKSSAARKALEDPAHPGHEGYRLIRERGIDPTRLAVGL